MKKTSTTVFTCQNCGHQSGKWLGKCPECGEWNSLVEERASTVRKGAARKGFQIPEDGAASEAGEENWLGEERASTVRKGAARNGFKLREVAAVAYDEIASQDDVRVPSG